MDQGSQESFKIESAENSFLAVLLSKMPHPQLLRPLCCSSYGCGFNVKFHHAVIGLSRWQARLVKPLPESTFAEALSIRRHGFESWLALLGTERLLRLWGRCCRREVFNTKYCMEGKHHHRHLSLREFTSSSIWPGREFIELSPIIEGK